LFATVQGIWHDNGYQSLNVTYSQTFAAPTLSGSASGGNANLSWGSQSAATQYNIYSSTDQTDWSYYDATSSTSYSTYTGYTHSSTTRPRPCTPYIAFYVVPYNSTLLEGPRSNYIYFY